ncbi:MAG: glycosyl hydrolase family 95 catalytic domain-containing protein [Lachnospiraceae bacterium]
MKLCYSEEATEWLEATPIGNGRLGAMIYGGAKTEYITLNEDTLWSGYPVQEYRGLSNDTYKKAAQFVRNGENKKAEETLEEELRNAEDTQMYLPFGTLKLKFRGSRNIVDYKRSLDLENAVVSVTYKNGERGYKHTSFVSQPSECIVYRIQSEETFSVDICAESKLPATITYTDNKVSIYGQSPGRSGFSVGESETMQAEHFFSDEDVEKGMTFEGCILLHNVSGSTRSTINSLSCIETNDVILYMFLHTSFNGNERHPFLMGKNTTLEIEKDMEKIDFKNTRLFDVIKDAHVQDYQSLFHRVSLVLGEGKSKEVFPEKEFSLFETGILSCDFCQALFDFGRYLLISSSRPYTQAANLQGIWNQETIPPWFCEYTTNINLQMNYWLVGPCNLPELMQPLVRLCKQLSEKGKKTAQEVFGCSGAASFHNVDIWGKSTPANGHAMWAYWPYGLAWLCRNLFDQYLFTEDLVYLEDIFPILHENTLFLSNMLEKTEEGYTIVMDTSPENEYLFGDESISIALYSENVNAIIRGAFRDYIRASTILEKEGDLCYRVKLLLPHLVQSKLGSQGQILEWDQEYRQVDVHHRHISHLYAFHPGDEWMNEGCIFKEGVKKSLLLRGDAGTGWSLAWKISMWARLGDGEHVRKIMQRLFHRVSPAEQSSKAVGGLYPNLFCAHPPFQIDGNLGYTSGVTEMILQSFENKIIMLPALLPEWYTGEVKHMLVRGGICVSVKWTAERVEYQLYSPKDKKIFLYLGNRELGAVQLKQYETLYGVVIRLHSRVK